MDIATIAGSLLGIILIVISILLEGSLLTFWSASSVMIVVGGIIASTLINYPLTDVIGVIKVIKIAFTEKTERPLELIEKLVLMAQKARREGLLALDNEIENIDDDFLQKGIQLVVDGTDPELVRNILETEIEMMEERHSVGANIMESMSASAPAYGMLGTVIGLILMLKNIDDPNSLGPGMSVALITTFYGSLLANLIFTPLSGKLKLRSREEALNKEIIVEGILSIQAGENPLIVAEKMKAFLSPKDKALLDQRKEEGIANET